MNVLDLIFSVIQFAVFIAALIISARLVIVRKGIALYQFLLGAIVCHLMAGLFWVLHIWITGYAPTDLSAADFSYAGFYCFMIMGELACINEWTDEERRAAKPLRVKALAAPVFIVACHVFIVSVVGGILNNLIYCVPLSFMGYYALLVYLARREKPSPVRRRYHGYVALFAVTDAAMLAISAEYGVEVLGVYIFDILYYVFSAALSVLILLIVFEARKEAAA